MNTLKFGLLALTLIAVQMVDACPFKFVNDSTHEVIIYDTKQKKSHHAAAGQTINVPGAVAEPTLWAYVDRKPVYGISEEECMPEGSPATELVWSKFKEMARTLELHGGIRIVDAAQFPDVPALPN